MDYKVLYVSTLLKGEVLEEVKDVCIVINKNMIEKIIPQSEFNAKDYSLYEMINLKDCVVIPGMIDNHNHTSLDARLHDHLLMMEDSVDQLTNRAVKNMEDDLMSGVTTARCLGERHYIDVALKQAIQQGEIVGPHLIVSGIGMRGVNGHGYVGLPHGSVDQFKATSIQNIERGVDFLKIFVTSGAPSPKGEVVPCFVSLEEIKTVVEQAKKVGISTAAHCIGGEGLHKCIEVGVDVIEHAYCASDEDIEALVKSNTWVCMTPGIILDEGREPYCPDTFVEIVRKTREDVRHNLEKVVKSGIRYAIGTDAYHGMLYRDVGYINQLGASTKEALAGVTVNAAKMCGISGKRGIIQEGYEADIIATYKNPLENTNHLADVGFVMKGGRIYKNEIEN